MTKKQLIPEEDLRRLYFDELKSARTIAPLFSCSEATVRARMRDLGMIRRGQEDCHNRYHKADFDGTDAEKAYLLGFRLGDLNVYTTTPKSRTIVVRSSTTHEAQSFLFQELFSKYGHVSIHPGTQCTQLHAYLNRSFAFLLPKTDEVPEWVASNLLNSLAYAAGYIDAEGSFSLNQGRARFKIDSYDFKTLSWMDRFLRQRGIFSKFRQIYSAGDSQGSLRYNKDLWRLNVNESYSLLYFMFLIKTLLRHGRRRRDAQVCTDNILDRMERGTIQRYTYVQ